MVTSLCTVYSTHYMSLKGHHLSVSVLILLPLNFVLFILSASLLLIAACVVNSYVSVRFQPSFLYMLPSRMLLILFSSSFFHCVMHVVFVSWRIILSTH